MNNPDLNKITKQEQDLDDNWIRVGMNTCGIAAGADDIYEYFKTRIEKGSLKVRLRKCGCLGACYAEPLVEVKVKGMPTIVYGNVTEKIAEQIIEKHIMTGRILNSGIYELKTIGI